MNDKTFLKHIAIDPEVMAGKPVIWVPRLTAEYLIKLLAHGETADGIVSEYRGVQIEDIQACLLFA